MQMTFIAEMKAQKSNSNNYNSNQHFLSTVYEPGPMSSALNIILFSPFNKLQGKYYPHF